MKDDPTSIFVFAAVFITMGLCLGFLVGINAQTGEMHREAVKNGCGHYDATTGNFVWGKP